MKTTTSITKQTLDLIINIAGGLEPIGWISEDEPVFEIGGNPKGAFATASEHEVAWGYYYDEISFDVVRGRQLTKVEFKKEYSSYRRYLAQCDESKMALINKYNN